MESAVPAGMVTSAGAGSGSRVFFAVFLSSMSLFLAAVLPFIAFSSLVFLTYKYGERSTEIGVLYLLLLFPRILLIACGAAPAFLLAFHGRGIPPRSGQVLLGLLSGLVSAFAVFAWSRWLAPSAAPRLIPSIGEVVLSLALGFVAAMVAAYGYGLVKSRGV